MQKLNRALRFAIFCPIRCRGSHRPAITMIWISDACMGLGVTVSLKQAIIDQAQAEDFRSAVLPIQTAFRMFRTSSQISSTRGITANVMDGDRQTWRANPRALWPDAQTIIILGESYAPEHDPTDILKHPEKGAISVYAQNKDYHDLVKKRLKRLARWLIAHSGGEVKVFVDTAPVSENHWDRPQVWGGRANIRIWSAAIWETGSLSGLSLPPYLLNQMRQRWITAVLPILHHSLSNRRLSRHIN